MTWQGVPFFVKDAEHAAEVMRTVGYLAGGAGDGIVLPTDCKVTASAIPDLNVNIAPGAVVALNRFAGGNAQSYIARNVGADVKALVAQGSGGVRYDLIAVVIQDPQYAGQPAPASVPNGPYVITKVYSNVPSTTRTLAEIDPNQTGVALALVKFDASDGTVNPADITDLRQMAMPRQLTEQKMQQSAATTNLPAAAAVHPLNATYPIYVPLWATKVQLMSIVSGIQLVDSGSGAGALVANAQVRLGTLMSNSTSFQMDAVAASKPQTTTVVCADEVDVPLAMRGTTQNLQSWMYGTVSGAVARSTVYTTAILSATFKEKVA